VQCSVHDVSGLLFVRPQDFSSVPRISVPWISLASRISLVPRISLLTSFDRAGSAILTYTSKGFGFWDTTGKESCSHQDMGNGTMAMSADGQYLASAPLGKGTDVLIWKVSEILGRCSLVH
jgi:hypothetical protein